eukprot:CAMPEP_0181317570 /NCGR_PEP_ID=MMETSP1101-20121128/16541_1 /TAXON_ID=46948 /ORGANISM="Rhodomonas abbreviata, Strain Caron Lab Isolate" /LENGTH=380 /DNA_ID=CAMNT_0023424977 /DNA_START=110 /DNA_END=1252 /DNA_ORIENTATION=-
MQLQLYPEAGRTLRLRGGVMWVGGGRQFNRSVDPTAGPETVEDTFTPLRDRLDRAERIKWLLKKHGPMYRTNEVISLEEESKYLIRAQKMLRAPSLSVDLDAASNFQKYVVGELEFANHRFGVMYGRTDQDGNVFCDAIYEPPQEGNDDAYALLPDPNAHTVELVASCLGLRRVGIVFTARSRKCILSSQDMVQACQLQEQLERQHGFDFARSCVAAVITRNETTGSIVFEAYQVSDLAMDMHRRHVFKPPSNSNRAYSRTTESVLVERKDTTKVDNDFFINTVPIKTHASPFFANREASFPVENRPTQTQNALEVKHVLKCHEDLPFPLQLRDFHLLVFLGGILDPVTDIPSLCDAVVEGKEPKAGHKELIECFAAQAD